MKINDWTVVGKTKKAKKTPIIITTWRSASTPNIVRAPMTTHKVIPACTHIHSHTNTTHTHKTFVPKPCSFQGRCCKIKTVGGVVKNIDSNVCFYIHTNETMENYTARTDGLCRFGLSCKKIRKTNTNAVWNIDNSNACKMRHPMENPINYALRMHLTPIARECGYAKCKKARLDDGEWINTGNSVCMFLHSDETRLNYTERTK